MESLWFANDDKEQLIVIQSAQARVYLAFNRQRNQVSYSAVRCCDISYGAVCPLDVFFFGASQRSVGKTVQHRFFSTVHRMKNREKSWFRTVLALFLGARTKPLFFYYCSGAPYWQPVQNPRVRTISVFFFSSRQSHKQQQILCALENRFNKSIRIQCMRIIRKNYVKIP